MVRNKEWFCLTCKRWFDKDVKQLDHEATNVHSNAIAAKAIDADRYHGEIEHARHVQNGDTWDGTKWVASNGN